MDDPANNPDLAQHWHHISDAQPTPTYALANFSRTVGERSIEGQTYRSLVLVEWRNLWTTPGGGELYLRFVVDGNRLKAEYIINEAARNWIAANASPTQRGISAGRISSTYFSFAFQVDWSDTPRLVVGGVLKSADEDFDDSAGGIELQNALGELLGFIPVDNVYSYDAEGVQQAVALRKRLWRDPNGNHYLVMGAPVTQVNNLPAGDLVFDPTISEQVGAGGDDGRWHIGPDFFSNSDSPQIAIGKTGGAYDEVHGFFRFPNVQFSGAPSSIDAAKITLYATDAAFLGSSGDTFNVYFEDAANPSAPTSQTDADGRILTTNFGSWNMPLAGTGLRDSPSLVAVIDELVASYDYVASPAAMQVLMRTAAAHTGQLWVQSYEGSAANAAQLTIDYTASGGGSFIDGAGSTAVSFSGTADPGVEHESNGSATVVLSETASPSQIHEVQNSESLNFSSTAIAEVVVEASVSEQITFSETASAEVIVEASASGIVEFAITASPEVVHEAQASDGITFSSTATGTTDDFIDGVGSTIVSFSDSAVAEVIVETSGQDSVIFSTTATGEITDTAVEGSGLAELLFQNVALSEVVHESVSAASVLFTGSAIAEVSSGVVTRRNRDRFRYVVYPGMRRKVRRGW